MVQQISCNVALIFWNYVLFQAAVSELADGSCVVDVSGCVVVDELSCIVLVHGKGF